MDSSGLISGTPAMAGTFNVLLSAYNANGWGGSTLVLTIQPAAIHVPTITSPLTARGIAGSPLQPYTLRPPVAPTH